MVKDFPGGLAGYNPGGIERGGAGGADIDENRPRPEYLKFGPLQVSFRLKEWSTF